MTSDGCRAMVEDLLSESGEAIVVTGAGGYIGAHLARTLAACGAHVVGVQRKARGGEPFTVVEGDLAQPGLLDGVLRPGSLVLHLASTSSVARSVEEPRQDLVNNLGSLCEVLESVRRAGSRLIHVSSICVADPESSLPHTESVRLSPRSPYGACKAAGELLVGTYFHCYGLRGIVVRLSTVFGPGLRRFAVYDFLRKLQANPRRIEILGSGDQLRDYLYLDDAVKGLLTVAARGRFGETYHLASGTTTTSRELALAVAAAMGIEAPEVVPLGHTFRGDIERWALDISKIRLLGFEPTVTLADGLRAFVESHRYLDAASAERRPQ